ncbi:hypothetical protein BST61_g10735 [Cercospora zeina]
MTNAPDLDDQAQPETAATEGPANRLNMHKEEMINCFAGSPEGSCESVNQLCRLPHCCASDSELHFWAVPTSVGMSWLEQRLRILELLDVPEQWRKRDLRTMLIESRILRGIRGARVMTVYPSFDLRWHRKGELQVVR